MTKTKTEKIKIPFGLLEEAIRLHKEEIKPDLLYQTYKLDTEIDRDQLLRLINESFDDYHRFMLGQYLK